MLRWPSYAEAPAGEAVSRWPMAERNDDGWRWLMLCWLLAVRRKALMGITKKVIPINALDV
jgi:hypothetical protein